MGVEVVHHQDDLLGVGVTMVSSVWISWDQSTRVRRVLAWTRRLPARSSPHTKMAHTPLRETLLCLSSRFLVFFGLGRGSQDSEDATGEITLDAATDFLVGFAFGTAFRGRYQYQIPWLPT